MAVKKKKDEELQQSQPQRNSTYSYGRENSGNAYTYGSKGELVSTGKNVYSSTKGYNQKASFVAYDKKTSGSTKQRTSGSSWTPGGSNPTGAQKYNPATMERIKSDTTLYKKWYSGSQPTLRETVARMYQVADGDEKKFAELEGMLYQEMGSKGSVIYNPYMQATNYKAIEGLQELGIDLSGGVTSDWLAANMGLLDYGRQTTTSYGPSAPTKTSTAQQDAAYWFNTLLKAEERTQLAEAEYKSLADEVKYWADLGYSDKEIVNRVRDNFGGKYKTLNTMDEDRIMGDATLLNRAVNYSGDDTIYGMIWAARNDGGSGDYFVDSVKYTMNEGNLYKRNRDSEAARDPSSYENFDPYSYSANTHDLNQKYGVTSYDTAWLEANRSMLADPDKAEDWRDMNDAVENYNAATVQLTALDQWLEKQVADGNDSATIEAKLAALIADGDSVWYANPDTGKREQIKLTTLQKMEDKRAEGTYLALSGAVPFTLPQYIEKAQAMVAERDAAKAQKEAEEAEKPTLKEKFTEGVQNFVGKAGRFLASMGIKGVGSYGESIDSALEAQENAYDANTIGKNFASSELGVEIHGDLKPYEQAAVNDMVAKVEIATQPKATQQQIDEANAAVAVLQDLLVQAANDPARQEQESYKTSEAWTSVVDALQNPREGMVEMVAEPTAFLGELEAQQQLQSVEDLPQMQAYANILQGGKWNGAVIDWAFAHSNNNNAIMAELVNGIIGHKTKGQELTGIAKSWWDKFGGLVDDLGGPETYDQLDLVDMGLADYDSRTAYGTQVFGALQMNEEAYETDAITPEQYAQNLIRISDLAEGISEMTDGARATDEQADSFLENVEGASGILEKVYDVCNTGMEEQSKDLANDQRQREARNIEVLRQYTAGEGITDQGAFFDIMLTDTTEAAANDKAYQDASAFFGRTLGFDGIADDGIAFTTGDAGMDASYGKDFLMAEGASLYSKGVSALAQATLDTHMKFATACGMSLEQFYQEFPEYARTPGQIAAEARSEYHGAWGEFGMTIEGLVSANDSIMNAGADIEGAPTGEQSADTLDVSDLIALAYDKVTAIGSLNLDKTLYMMQHGWKDKEAERDILLTQYGDRAGVKSGWDKTIAEYKKRKAGDMDYEEWRAVNPDKALDELMAKRDTVGDILDLGDPAKWSSQQAIVEKTGNIAYIDKLVAENGSEFDKKVYDGVTGLMQTGQFMYQSVMLGGGYGASLAATLTSSGADAFDRFQESGDYDAALLASAGAWLVNAAIETSLDRFAPAALGGDREMRMALAKANLSKLGMFKWMKDPKTMSKMAREVITLVAGGTMNVTGESVEESLQALVDITADNIVYGNGILPTGEQIGQVVQAGKDAVWMSIIMEGGADLVYGSAKMTDYAGNAISKAEAQLLPEHDGVILNSAIEFEATAMAIANSGDALAQIEASSENQQLQEVTKQMQDIDTELAEAETELAAAEQEQADAALALEAVDNERVESDVFTEDMSKRMVAAATNLQAAGEKVGKSRERAEAARSRKAEAQQHHDELKAKVQSMYNQVMDEAKERYSMVVAEKYYGNDTAEQQSASNAYLEACKEMQDIKKKLAEARAEMNTYGTGTPRGEQARKNYGKRLLEADKAAEKVAMAKANMDAAYDNSPEARMENVHNAELAKAEQIAMEAAEAAAADPMNVRKAQAADVEQAKLDTIRAKQEMEEARSGISQRLNSPDSKVRDQAVSDWKALQQKASDAADTAAALETEFNETDTQKNLRAAIDNMKQYSNEQLVLDDAEGHQDAVRAYNELQLAMVDAEVENQLNALNTVETGTAEHSAAMAAYNEALTSRENEIGRQLGVTGDAVRASLKKSSLGTQVLDAVQRGNQQRASTIIKQILDTDSENRGKLIRQAVKQRQAFQLNADMETGAQGKAGVTHAYSRQAKKNLSKDSRLQLDVLNEVAKDAGFEIVVKDSLSNVEGAVNGVLSKGGTIYIGLDAIEQGYLQAGTHEMVHGIRRRDNAAYDELQQVVTDILKEQGLDIDQMVQDRISSYDRLGQAINADDALEEIVAESAAQIWGSEANMQKFAEEHPNAFKKAYDAFMNFWTRVRDISNRIAGRNDRKEITAMLSDDGALQKVYDTFMRVAKETNIEPTKWQEKFSLNNLDGDNQIDYTAGINTDGGIENDRILQRAGRKEPGGSDGRRTGRSSAGNLSWPRRSISTELAGKAAVHLDRGTDRGIISSGKAGYDAYLKAVGDSKITDNSGQPVVVYHGTRASFKEFGKGQRNYDDAVGYYFSSSPIVAERYAGNSNQNGEAVLHPVAIKASNPLILTAKQLDNNYNTQNKVLSHIARAKKYVGSRNFISKVERMAYNPNNGIPSSVADAIVKAFKGNGDIDCLVVKNCTWDFKGAKPNDQYVVFDSKQIVPATEQYWAEWAEENSPNDYSLNESAWNQDIANDLAEQLMTNTGNAAQIADILGRMEGDMWRDHRAAGRTGETTTADRNPIEILSDLTSRIRIGYNPGGSMNEGNRRLPRAVQGFYNRHARSITTRTSAAGDLEIGLHEFGHAVQQRLPNLHANQQLLNGLSQGVRNAYDQRELDGEAIAEFVVDYIFSRDEAVRQAGAQFVQDFEDMMANDRDLYEAVMDASHQTELWNNADVGSKMDAMIKEGNDPRRGQIGNALQRLARNIETAVADLTAPADLVSRDFRRSALYSMHASRRADVSLTRFLIDPQGRNIGQSLAERFYRAGVAEGDQAEVSRYALARHALDRRRRNRDVFSEAEFPTADLEAYIADVEANHPNIVAGADALTSFWNDFMDAWWVGTGMIDADDVATMRAMYPHYVPTFRVVGENFNQYGGRNSRFQMRRAVEGGSSLEVIDPIASIVKMTQQMTSTVTQNQLMREFHNEWRRGGLGEIADDVTQDYRVQRNDTTRLQGALDAIAATGMVDPALMDDAYAQMLNLQERWYGTGQNYDANVVSGVDENGNRFFYKIKDRGLYNLLSGTAGRNGDMGAILNTVRNFKNAFTKLTTGSNPLFALKNMQRDIQASVNTGTHSLTYADGMYHWVRAFYEVLTGSDTYREWQAMGGGEHTRFNTELNGREAGAVVRELGRDLMRGRVTRRGNFRTRNTALENISNVLTWEQLNNAVENASRYVEYRFGRHDLGTDEGRREAFMASQDVTTNFGTHGASGTIKVLNQIVPFMNATIQGLNKDVNIIRDALSGDANRRRQAAPKAAKTLMNTALTAALQYALLKMFGSNEDDEDYALLSQEMRTGNLIIPIGKAAMEELGDVVGFDKPYIRIPIAQGPLAQGMYAKALDLIADVANYSPMEVDMWRAAKSILSDSIPDGTVFQAISDAKNNRTWYGGEIESEYMRNYSVTNRYSSDTPRAIIELGQMLNVSPAKLDYLLNQYSGFAGKIIMPLLSTGRLNGEGGLDERAKNLAYNVLKNYTIDPVSSNDLSTSYTAAKATISQIIADGKADKPMGDLAYSVDPDEAYSAAEYLSEEFTALDKEIAALWSEYNAIKDSDMSDGDKARQMRDIRRNYIVPLQQDAMALYEEYKMQYIDADSLALEIYGRLPGGLTRPTLD